MSIKPTRSRVLVVLDELEEKTKGGVFLPTTAVKKNQTGTVKAVGKEVKNLKIAPGKRILMRNYSGVEVEVKDSKHCLVEEEDVLALIE